MLFYLKFEHFFPCHIIPQSNNPLNIFCFIFLAAPCSLEDLGSLTID